MDADALDKGIAIKNMGLDKPRMIVLDNKTEIKINLKHDLHIIEGILQEKVCEEKVFSESSDSLLFSLLCDLMTMGFNGLWVLSPNVWFTDLTLHIQNLPLNNQDSS